MRQVVFVVPELSEQGANGCRTAPANLLINENAEHQAARILLAGPVGDPTLPGQERLRNDIFRRDPPRGGGGGVDLSTPLVAPVLVDTA